MSQPHFRQRPWGYDRREVDAFVERTAGRLAAAESERTPDEAVREALDRVGDETSSILQRAHQIADELTARSREEAAELTARSREEAAELTARSREEAAELTARSHQEAAERLQQAEHEAAVIRRSAEDSVTELDAEIDALWQERRQLLDDIERMLERFHALVLGARERFPAEEPDPDATVAIEETGPDATVAIDGDAPGSPAEADTMVEGPATVVIQPDETEELTEPDRRGTGSHSTPA